MKERTLAYTHTHKKKVKQKQIVKSCTYVFSLTSKLFLISVKALLGHSAGLVLRKRTSATAFRTVAAAAAGRLPTILFIPFFFCYIIYIHFVVHFVFVFVFLLLYYCIHLYKCYSGSQIVWSTMAFH